MAKTYRLYSQESGAGSERDVERFSGHEDEIFTETLIDTDTQEGFKAEIMVSPHPKEGYDLLLIQGRGTFLEGEWHVKIIQRVEEEEEEVTVFQSMRLGERRGYMLRSMATEEKDKLKKEAMTTELEERLKKKQELVKRLRRKGE